MLFRLRECNVTALGSGVTPANPAVHRNFPDVELQRDVYDDKTDHPLLQKKLEQRLSEGWNSLETPLIETVRERRCGVAENLILFMTGSKMK